MANSSAPTNQITRGVCVSGGLFPLSPHKCPKHTWLAHSARGREIWKNKLIRQTWWSKKARRKSPSTCGRRPLSERSGGAAARRLSQKVPTPELRGPLDPQIGRGRGALGGAGPLSGPAAPHSRRPTADSARKGERLERATEKDPRRSEGKISTK